MPYLTPDTLPTDILCRVLFIPNSVDFLSIVTGALEELTFLWNFDKYGTLTPAETVEAFLPMFNAFCLSQGECRVIGEIITYAGDTSPYSNWFVCNGDSLLRADFPDLFDVIGTTYGAVDGTHFNLPDLRGRAISGVGNGAGLSPVALGDSYGEEAHTLTTAEVPAHSHTDSGHTHVEGNASPTLVTIGTGVPTASAIPSVGITSSGSANLDSSGGDGSHNTIGPRLAITCLIVAY
jgi:microcystin-dependent protein